MTQIGLVFPPVFLVFSTPIFYMTPGLFGFSLLFEVLVFYYALHLLWTNTNKLWVYLALGIVLLISVSDLTGARWAEIFSGRYDFFWDEIFWNFGFR